MNGWVLVFIDGRVVWTRGVFDSLEAAQEAAKATNGLTCPTEISYVLGGLGDFVAQSTLVDETIRAYNNGFDEGRSLGRTEGDGAKSMDVYRKGWMDSHVFESKKNRALNDSLLEGWTKRIEESDNTIREKNAQIDRIAEALRKSEAQVSYLMDEISMVRKDAQNAHQNGYRDGWQAGEKAGVGRGRYLQDLESRGSW